MSQALALAPETIHLDASRPYGHLAEEQRAAVAGVVRGKHVVDVGAGSMVLSGVLLQLGASMVTAMDRHNTLHVARELGLRVTVRTPATDKIDGTAHPLRFDRSNYKSFSRPNDADVAWLSWPQTYGIEGLTGLLDGFSCVAVLSKNTNGNVCGDPDLYRYLVTRPLLGYYPRRRNTLMIYAKGEVKRRPRGEERAGLSTWTEDVILYEELREDLA